MYLINNPSLSHPFFNVYYYTFQPPKPSDICTICYTSGTTGNPKGVMLTHENVIASVSAVILQLGDHKPTSSDVMISFLPLAHMLERCCEVVYYTPLQIFFYYTDLFLECNVYGWRQCWFLSRRHQKII